MNFAIYTRKSIYSDQSDSTTNQSNMCRDFITSKFRQISSIEIYEDEGITGATTNRPDLKRLMSDIENKMIDFLVVYQLDRLSRDVRDFSNIYSFLEEHGVEFISIKENIDTSTPIGKAMMYVSVVFAQMERETIASRVTDNMIGLSDAGWWVGGNPPIGYIRQRIDDESGKKHVIIVPEEDGMKFVKMIFDIFISHSFSLSALESYIKHNHILTKSGKFLSSTQLHKILTMPYCVPATPEVYDYYEKKGCIMSKRSPRENWNGEYGVMVYGRTTERKRKHSNVPPDQWRVCIGKHRPFLDADTWLAAQRQLSTNIFSCKMQHPIPLLKGSLRCSCGRLMSLTRKKKVDGSLSTWYACPKRMRQGIEYCGMKQIKADVLDKKVFNLFSQIAICPELIDQYIEGLQDTSVENEEYFKKAIEKKNQKIKTLTKSLSSAGSSPAMKYIISEIELLDSEISDLNKSLINAQAKKREMFVARQGREEKRKYIQELVRNFDSLSADERNRITKKILKECTWDGVTLSVVL